MSIHRYRHCTEICAQCEALCDLWLVKPKLLFKKVTGIWVVNNHIQMVTISQSLYEQQRCLITRFYVVELTQTELYRYLRCHSVLLAMVRQCSESHPNCSTATASPLADSRGRSQRTALPKGPDSFISAHKIFKTQVCQEMAPPLWETLDSPLVGFETAVLIQPKYVFVSTSRHVSCDHCQVQFPCCMTSYLQLCPGSLTVYCQ